MDGWGVLAGAITGFASSFVLEEAKLIRKIRRERDIIRNQIYNALATIETRYSSPSKDPISPFARPNYVIEAYRTVRTVFPVSAYELKETHMFEIILALLEPGAKLPAGEQVTSQDVLMLMKHGFNEGQFDRKRFRRAMDELKKQ